jgi:hypothetical protein
LESLVKIDRHPIDAEFAKKLFADAVTQLPSFVEGARRDPRNLSLLIREALTAAGSGCIVEPQSPQVANALKIAQEAHVAMFAASRASGKPAAVTLAGQAVSFTTSPAPSTVHVMRWISAAYLTILVGERPAIDELCQTSPELLRQSRTKGAEYHYLYMEGLRRLLLGQQDGVDRLIEAVKMTDPNRPDISDPDWTLYLHAPQLEVLIYLATSDAKFSQALTNGIQKHNQYWSKTQDRRRDYRGFISIELTALAAWGRSRSLNVEVESPYLAMQLTK